MTDITRQNLKELHNMVKQEMTSKGYHCDVLDKTEGFSGSYLVCKPFGDPTIKRAYELSIPTIFEHGKYIVGESKQKIELSRCANEECIGGRIINKYRIINPKTFTIEKLIEKIADDIEINFVEPNWMKG